MPRTRSLAWSELKIGVLTIVAVVIAAVLVLSLTGARGFAWQRYNLKTRFENVAGLQNGSPVRVAGVEIGTVTDVTFAGEQVEVTFEVNKTSRERITTSSIAVLGSVSLLGESAVDISPSTKGTPIPEWGYVPNGRAKGQLSDVAEQASSGIQEITGLVHDIRQGRGTAGKLITDDRLYAEMQQFVTTAGDLVKGINDGRGTLGKLIKDPKTADALQATLANLERTTSELNAGRGTIGKLLHDDALATSLAGVTSNLQDLTAKLNRGEGTIGKLLTDQALFDRLNMVTGRIDELVTKLNDGQGTVGQLLKDKQLYENMNGVVSEMRNLLSAIQKDPKKYLNIKVSIF